MEEKVLEGKKEVGKSWRGRLQLWTDECAGQRKSRAVQSPADEKSHCQSLGNSPGCIRKPGGCYVPSGGMEMRGRGYSTSVLRKLRRHTE